MPQQVSAILLAAGSSKRMGQSKLLLPLKGQPIIRHCIDPLISSVIKDIVVVLRSGDTELIHAVNGLPVHIVFNTISGSDMADSVRTGLSAVDEASTGILISLADQPLVSLDTIKMLVAYHNREPEKILIPQYKKKKGHPVVFPRNLLQDIFDGGILRDIIKKYSGRTGLLPVDDEGIILDIDLPEDYRDIQVKIGDVR